MATEHEEYLAVLKASYDYDPQSDDEIAIKEDQLLFLKERVDDDWWKVKIKGDSQDGDSPVGLVPSAYVEQAEHTSVVKAIYDYEAAAPGELSVTEDEILFVFDTEDDWLLVQSQKDGGKAGFVPGNYVELFDEGAVPVPDTPNPSARPASAYVDPADLVASTKVKSDGIETWSVSEIDKKGKKKKGTLGVGNGAVFFASEADKTPVQKWQTIDIETVKVEKAKHIHISIGGTTPIALHFHTGSKDNADAIESKLRSSKTLSMPSTAKDAPNGSDAQVPGRPSIEVPKEIKKVSVHFSTTSPTIIPRDPSIDQEEDEDEAVSGGQDSSEEIATALYDFAADGDDELSVTEGEQLLILERDGDEWWKCRNSHGAEGVVPASYLEVPAAASKPPLSTPAEDDDDEGDSVSAQQMAREAEAKAEELRIKAEQEEVQAEKARKKAEAQERAKAAAIAAEVERKKRKEAAVARISPPPATHPPPDVEKPSSGRTSRDGGNTRPPADKVRVWHDRTGQFRVEAAFLGFSNGKLRLHKVNGVVVEVPSEKMSMEDMDYIEKVTKRKKSRPPATQRISEDDIPLGVQRTTASSSNPKPSATPKKSPRIDWFDFFLSAGCDLDDCTRYAASFERDKIDESILPDITESTMRSLGLREGDIIRTMKAIEKRKPTDNLIKPSTHTQEQLLRDEELARKLQAQEAGSTRSPPPNLFTGPGGVLKSGGRKRPVPTKSAPATVDLKAIATVSDQIQRTGSPQQMSPHNARVASASVQPPPRSNSALPVASGFDDDAWTNRPSSTQPLAGTPPSTTPRAPSAPPSAPPAVPTPPPAKPTTSTPPLTKPATPTPTPVSVTQLSAPSLAKTTESDIFEQLSRLSDLRKNTPTNPPVSSPLGTTPPAPPPSFQAGLGMGSSPVPMGHIQTQQSNSYPQSATPTYNGPRGPYAPVPSNQSLLQPLIPTQTGFNNFIPTRPTNSLSPFQNPPAQPSFLPSQPTGFSNVTMLPSQPTGFHNIQPVASQPTGAPFNTFNPGAFQNNGFSPVPSNFTGAGPGFNASPFGSMSSPPPPVPPLPNSPPNNTNPANIFAQMKSGTFANENNQNPSPSDKYDALRPNALAPQATGWGQQPYQTGWNGYQQR